MSNNLIMFIGLPVAGIVLGWIIRWCYARFQLSASEQKAERLRQDAIKEAEAALATAKNSGKNKIMSTGEREDLTDG